MVLSHKDIENYIRSGDIKIEPYSGDLQPASYDLRVGKQAATQEGRIDVEKIKDIKIPRGAIVIVKPLERIELSKKIVARYGLRSKFARKGLVLLSGPQIKPGWKGTLSITIFNAGSSTVNLSYEEEFAEIEFSKLESPAEKDYKGHHQNQSDKISDSEMELATKEYSNLMDLDKSQRNIEASQGIIMNFIYLVLFAVLAGVLVNIFKIVLPTDISIPLNLSSAIYYITFAIIIGLFFWFSRKK